MVLQRDMLEDIQPKYRSLDTVRLRKSDLIEVIEKNREEHRAIFEEAITAWHQKIQERLQKLVEQAKKGPDAVELVIGLPRPEDHSRDYDRIIKMLSLSQDEELELTQAQFAQYVMDDWGWQRQFLTETASYSQRARGKFDSFQG